MIRTLALLGLFAALGGCTAISVGSAVIGVMTVGKKYSRPSVVVP